MTRLMKRRTNIKSIFTIVALLSSAGEWADVREASN